MGIFAELEFGVVPIGLSILVFCLMQIWFAKKIGTKRLVKCHEVGNAYFSVVGTFYAVLVGLIVYDAQSRFSESKANVESEASSTLLTYIIAEQMPSPQNAQLKKELGHYTERVIHNEWETLKSGVGDEDARQTLIRISQIVTSIEPVTQSDAILLDKLVDDLSDAWKMRRARIDDAARDLPFTEWLILIIGGVVTIIFGYFFALEDRAIQVTMTALLTLIISLNIYAVFEFSHLYSGNISIPQIPFLAVERYIHSHP